MAETLTVYEAGQTTSRAKGENYEVTAPFTGKVAKLKRDVDFGVIPGTKQPSLFKAGAQKIANAFGLLQRFVVESAIEDPAIPLFFYRIRCDLIKIAQDGTEYIFATGHGSSNTMERRNGKNPAWDSANATLKMAEKRALTAAVLSVSGLSDMFTQDMENEDFMNQPVSIENPDDVITDKQRKFVYTTASRNGISTDEAKRIMKDFGYDSAIDIKKKDLDDILNKFREGKENA